MQSARQASDRKSINELQQSLNLLNKIGQVQQQQAQKQQQQPAATPAAPPQSSGRYDLNLTINGHSLGTVQASSQSQAEQIIAALQAAQRTSTIQ